MGLKLNGTHQLLADADDVNLLGDNTGSIKRNTETITDASKEVGLEVDVEKIIYVGTSSPEVRSKLRYQTGHLKVCHNQIFGNDSNKSKCASGGSYGDFEFLLRLLPFSSETSVVSSSVQNCKKNTKNYNFSVVLYGWET
jgi:hypothetical protein